MNSEAYVQRLRGELAEIAPRWPWLLALGTFMVIAGVVALTSAFAATVASVLLIGSFLIVSGIAHVAMALSAHGWRGKALHLLSGVLAGVTGVVLIVKPLTGAEVLTLVLAILFLVVGSMRVVGAVTERFHGWVWSFASGLLSIMLGLLVLLSWPLSGTWFLGLYLGIDFIFSGMTWVVFSLALRRIAPREHRLHPAPA